MSRPLDILLVEDNAADARLTREVLREIGANCNLRVAKDAIDALAMLRQEGGYHDFPRPDLILVDLALPKKDGLEFLDDIKRDPILREITCAILSSSEAERDIRESFNRDIWTYISKPPDAMRIRMLLDL